METGAIAVERKSTIIDYIRSFFSRMRYRYFPPKSNLVKHAERELEFMNDGEEINQWMRKDILQIVKVFSKQGHSGGSAPYAIKMISTLLSFEPIRPLTGEDGEWNEVSEGLFQNKRCSRVFKKKWESL